MSETKVRVTVPNLLTASVKAGDVFSVGDSLYHVDRLEPSAMSSLDSGINQKVFAHNVTGRQIHGSGCATGMSFRFNQGAPYTTFTVFKGTK